MGGGHRFIREAFKYKKKKTGNDFCQFRIIYRGLIF